MANAATARQSNTDATVQEPGGYSGSTKGISGGNTAIRKSVAFTQGGSVALKSEVYSETMCFRTAYAGQDGDTGVEADGGDTQARGD